MVNKQYNQIIVMRRKNMVLRKTIKRLKNKNYNHNNDKYREAVSSIFNEDQMNILINKSRVQKWSNVTIKKALKLKFSCGVSGYEELLNQGMPLPSIRTLRRKLEDVKFETGICSDMLQFLEYKKLSFDKETDIECGLVFYEMSITAQRKYNPATGDFVGHITFPGKKGIAKKALVFMLVGIANRWKHIIGYHFTGNSFHSKILKHIIFQIINKVELLEFHVNFLTCDMGSGNLSLWRLLGISTGRYAAIKNSITHPYDCKRKLYIIADPPHLIKNLKQALVNNEFITISDDIMTRYNLTSKNIEIKHFKELIQMQENLQLVLTLKLKLNDIKCNNFDKMKVNKTTRFFSNDVSSAFKLVAEQREIPEFVSTVWFVQLIQKWFTLMTSRHYKLAINW